MLWLGFPLSPGKFHQVGTANHLSSHTEFSSRNIWQKDDSLSGFNTLKTELNHYLESSYTTEVKPYYVSRYLILTSSITKIKSDG